jgi:hypothetical protein
MTWDRVWQIARYLLIALGSFVAGKGWISAEQWETIVGAIGAIGSVVWGLYVKTGTAPVPIKTAERQDVPTVSGATGATIPGTQPVPTVIGGST